MKTFFSFSHSLGARSLQFLSRRYIIKHSGRSFSGQLKWRQKILNGDIMSRLRHTHIKHDDNVYKFNVVFGSEGEANIFRKSETSVA